MYCKNCGEPLNENHKECPFCKEPVAQPTAESTPAANDDVVVVAPSVVEIPSNTADADSLIIKKSKKKKTAKAKKSGGKGGLIAGLAAGAVVLVGAIVALLIFFPAAKTNDCEKAVKEYLEYFSSESKDVSGFITNAYMGGNFGTVLNGKDAEEFNVALTTAMFAADQIGGNMYSYDVDLEDVNWKAYLKDSSIGFIYDLMDDTFGDWTMTYEILESEKLSDSKIESLQEDLEDFVEYYEEYLDDLNLSGDDEDTFEDYLDYISDIEITEAYSVKTNVRVEGDDAELNKNYTFKVAKMDEDWVILDGPSIDEIIGDAK